MSRLAAALAFALTVSAAALACAGCGGASGPISLGWHFADGRRCSDTGVSQVLLGGVVACPCGDAGGACDCKFTCQDGEQTTGGAAGKSVKAELSRSGEITAQALSPVGGVLYRGVTRVDSTNPVTIELYFTGGR